VVAEKGPFFATTGDLFSVVTKIFGPGLEEVLMTLTLFFSNSVIFTIIH
jgi:hypothetical protein